jgi:hypothetical protein
MIIKTLLKIVYICIAIGVLIGVLALFHNNPTELFGWMADWCTWIVNSVADFVQGNPTTRGVIGTHPGLILLNL